MDENFNINNEEYSDDIANETINESSNYSNKIGWMITVFMVVSVIIIALTMLSKGRDKYEVVINGNNVSIPCSYFDIEDLGYSIETVDKMITLEPGETDWIEVKNSSGKMMELIIKNRSGVEKKIRECDVIGISVDKGYGANFQLTNGVKIGMSIDDIYEIMGYHSTMQYMSYHYTEQVGMNQYKIIISYYEPDMFSGYSSYNFNAFLNYKVTSITVKLEN